MKKKQSNMICAHAETGRTCGECKFGEWQYWTVDYAGKPFVIHCEHGKVAFSRVFNVGVCYDTTEACKCFQIGEKGG